MPDPFEKRAVPNFDAVLRQIQYIEEDIKKLTAADEVSEFKDAAHFVFEELITAIYVDPEAFWEAQGKVLN